VHEVKLLLQQKLFKFDKMKKLILVLLVTIVSYSVFANNFNGNNYYLKSSDMQCLKKIDITITTGGYTIHIVGNASVSLFGNLTMSGTISITGNGLNLSLPFSYNGSLSRLVISNSLQYDDSRILEEDKPAVDFLVRSIIFEKGGARLNFMGK
jgi:hypothetical protein